MTKQKALNMPRDLKPGRAWYYVARSRRSIEFILNSANYTQGFRFTEPMLRRMLSELKPKR